MSARPSCRTTSRARPRRTSRRWRTRGPWSTASNLPSEWNCWPRWTGCLRSKASPRRCLPCARACATGAVAAPTRRRARTGFSTTAHWALRWNDWHRAPRCPDPQSHAGDTREVERLDMLYPTALASPLHCHLIDKDAIQPPSLPHHSPPPAHRHFIKKNGNQPAAPPPPPPPPPPVLGGAWGECARIAEALDKVVQQWGTGNGVKKSVGAARPQSR